MIETSTGDDVAQRHQVRADVLEIALAMIVQIKEAQGVLRCMVQDMLQDLLRFDQMLENVLSVKEVKAAIGQVGNLVSILEANKRDPCFGKQMAQGELDQPGVNQVKIDDGDRSDTLGFFLCNMNKPVGDSGAIVQLSVVI